MREEAHFVNCFSLRYHNTPALHIVLAFGRYHPILRDCLFVNETYATGDKQYGQAMQEHRLESMLPSRWEVPSSCGGLSKTQGMWHRFSMTRALGPFLLAQRDKRQATTVDLSLSKLFQFPYPFFTGFGGRVFLTTLRSHDPAVIELMIVATRLHRHTFSPLCQTPDWWYWWPQRF
jgi:hypothetical protein